MSKSVYIHVCGQRNPQTIFISSVCFDVGYAANQLTHITPHAQPIVMPVSLVWAGVNRDIRWPAGSHHASVVDTSCTWLVYAGTVKPLRLHNDDDPADCVAVVRAAKAYLRELPDDWPLIIHWV